MASAKNFLIFLLAALIATPVAVANLVSIRIGGVVFCSVNGNLDVINGLATQVFPNASVQLQCGARNVVSNTTTNGSGVFSLVLNPLVNTLPLLLSNCSLVVLTPLSTCNATLPAEGLLQSPLQLVNTIIGSLDLHPSVNLGPAGFLLNLNRNL